MSNYKTVFFTLGILQIILGIFMSVPIITQYLYTEIDSSFIISSIITLIFGSLFLISNLDYEKKIDLHQAFLITSLSWISVAIFGSLPFFFSNLNLSFTDSFFESMSGITTTGSTIITNLENAPKSILLWRALLQWLGGIGIIVMAIAILPMLSIGGMQLFKTESYETPDKIIPRAAIFASGISIVYIVLTSTWAFMLWLAGMPIFDSITHAMTTLATGGYSTKSESLGAFNSVNIEMIIVLGMIVGSLPFIHYLSIFKNGWKNLINDQQVKWFLLILFFLISIVTFNLYINGQNFFSSLRVSIFNVVSIVTGTGFGTDDFSQWGGFATTLLLILMFMGGCAGSTTCGLRMARIQVLIANAKTQVLKLLTPHAVIIPYYNKKPIPESVTESVMGFFFLYILVFIIISCLLGSLGLDFMTSLSGAASAIGNVGPGLGEMIGPNGTYAEIPNLGKLILCLGMILGRLEIFAILVMFTASFWKK